MGNTINANVLDFNASDSQTEFHLDSFKDNTVTAEPQTLFTEERKIQFTTELGGALHIGNVTGNKLTNIGFAFKANSEAVVTIGDVANNEVAGQTFEGYSFEALDEGKLTLTSFNENKLTTSLPAGTYETFHPVYFYAHEAGNLTVTGAMSDNNFSTSTESPAIQSSGMWVNMAEWKGTITFEGPISQNNLQHEDRVTGTPPLGYGGDAILKFEAQDGGQLVVKEALSNNTLTGTGYFSGLAIFSWNWLIGSASDPTTLVDLVKGVDHLTVTLDTTYGLDPASEPINASTLNIDAREKVNSPVNVHVHIGGFTNNTLSFIPRGYGVSIDSHSAASGGGQASVLVDALDNNQITVSTAKDPATGAYTSTGGGRVYHWTIEDGATVTINSFQDNAAHFNNDPVSRVGAFEFLVLYLSLPSGGTLTVRNGSGNTATALGYYVFSALLKLYHDDSLADFGAGFSANNPDWLSGGIIANSTSNGTLIW